MPYNQIDIYRVKCMILHTSTYNGLETDYISISIASENGLVTCA